MDVPMPLYQLVYITFLSTAVCSLDESILEGLPYNLRMESSNFQHILSWQAKHDPAVPTSYNVLYRDPRSWKWVTPKECSGIAQLSCELTEEFKDRFAEYSVLVQSIGGTQVLNSSVLRFVPFTGTLLGPPEVNITSCPNCINVTIKLPPSHVRDRGKLLSLIDLYEVLDYDITLRSLDGEHKRSRQKTTEEVFSTVIEELYPNRNYCVSVVVTASLNRHSIPSPWKCVTADSEARQGYREVAVAGAVCVSLIIAAVLKCVHTAGFILQKKSLPQTLAFIRKLPFSLWVFDSEEVASVEIIPREVKRKARGCRGSASDESDSESSDSDSSAVGNHDYTRREGLGRGRVPPGGGSPSSPGQYSVNSACEHSHSLPGAIPGALPSAVLGAVPAAEPREAEEPELRPEGHRATGSDLLSPFSEGSCDSQGGSECFTINLHSVLLGALEEDRDGSAAAPSAQEDAGGWHCADGLETKLLEDTGSMQGAPCSNDFHGWQNSSSSEESDSSDLDTEQVTGYMRR